MIYEWKPALSRRGPRAAAGRLWRMMLDGCSLVTAFGDWLMLHGTGRWQTYVVRDSLVGVIYVMYMKYDSKHQLQLAQITIQSVKVPLSVNIAILLVLR